MRNYRAVAACFVLLILVAAVRTIRHELESGPGVPSRRDRAVVEDLFEPVTSTGPVAPGVPAAPTDLVVWVPADGCHRTCELRAQWSDASSEPDLEYLAWTGRFGRQIPAGDHAAPEGIAIPVAVAPERGDEDVCVTVTARRADGTTSPHSTPACLAVVEPGASSRAGATTSLPTP